MKNVHILPTKKETKLYSYNGKLFLDTISDISTDKISINQTIYITSDKEIKEGDWCIDEKENIVKADKDFIFNCSHEFNEFWKKIILTTDQDLIKDGVQDISDEFLEWFVKNSSCEVVEVEEHLIDTWEYSKIFYKIIIPKEEPKPIHQQIIDIVGGENKFREIAKIKPKQEPFKHEVKSIPKEEILANRSNAYEFINFDKQETLEEAAKKYSERHQDVSGNLGKYLVSAVFIDGAKWQQEKSYSEDEVKNILMKLRHDIFIKGDVDLEKWFKQSKKK